MDGPKDEARGDRGTGSVKPECAEQGRQISMGEGMRRKADVEPVSLGGCVQSESARQRKCTRAQMEPLSSGRDTL